MQAFEQLLGTFDLTLVDGVMILICAVLFCILWMLLEKLLFLPYLKLFEAREKATVGSKTDSESVTEKAQTLNKQYEEVIKNSRVEAMEEKLSALAEAKSEASKIVSQAEDEAKEIVKTARAQIDQDLDALRGDAEMQAKVLAQSIADKLKTPPNLVSHLVLFALLISSLTIFLPSTSWAGAGAGEHAASIADLLFPAINFVLYCIIMYFLLAKTIKRALDKRRKNYRWSVEQGVELLRKANKELALAQNKIRSVEQEISNLRSKIGNETKQEALNILAEAKSRAKRVVAHAKESAQAEAKVAQTVLRKELADLTIELAEKKLRSDLDLESDKVLRSHAVSGVGALK